MAPRSCNTLSAAIVPARTRSLVAAISSGRRGSSRWQTFWHVTLPLLKPSILIVLLLRTMDLLRVFDQIFILTEGGPGFATETISLYIYRTAFRFFDFGYAAAMSFVLLALTNVISALYIKFLQTTES